VSDDLHEVERNLSLMAAAGFRLPADDDGRLAVHQLDAAAWPIDPPDPRYVVVHPGASVPARTLTPRRWRSVVAALASIQRVVVTGGPRDTALTRLVSAGLPNVVDFGGRSDFDTLVHTIASAEAIVVGNTGPAHIAAAVGTPVVSVFPPTVPAPRWRPWMVPHVLLGAQDIACRDCRARVCPFGDPPCLAPATPAAVVHAVDAVAAERTVGR
jgi:ADP-heptose:LPS heptosyltransferase